MSFKPDIGIAPGWTIRREIEAMWIKQEDFANKLDISSKHLSHLINWKSSLTYKMAKKLEFVTGIKASFWNKLEAKYQEDKERIKVEQDLKNEIKLLKKITCYKNLIDLWLVEKTKNKLKQIKEMLKFLWIASLKNIEYSIPKLAFRKTDKFDLSKENLICWLKAGEEEIKKDNLWSFNKNKILEIIPKLKDLTKDENNINIEKTKKILNNAWIYFTVLSRFDKLPINWVSRYYNGHPFIQVSLRYKYIDVFWFSLFHELWHLYHDHLQNDEILINTKNKNKTEKEADKFASNKLITKKVFDKYIKKYDIENKEDRNQLINKIASEEWVWKNIVAGRLTNEFKDRDINIYKLTYSLRPTID